MEIIGQGHKGIVVADGARAVKKFYLLKAEGQREQAHLTLLANLQRQGLGIGCTIPKLLENVGQGTWQLAGKTYSYCSRLERIAGTAANLVMPNLTEQELEILGRDLGAVIFDLHHLSKNYKEQWQPILGNEDKLLAHILEEKAAQVTHNGTDEDARTWAQDAASYLAGLRKALSSERVLSHQDLNPSNILVGTDGRVNGVVDWGGLGPTSASLSLYQLVPTAIWPYVKQQYEDKGGVIREDILYAATTIHLAWAPIICRRLGIPLDENETREWLEVVRTKFAAQAGYKPRLEPK